MKQLTRFETFDAEAFFAGKELRYQGVKELKDFDSGKVLGSKVELVIVADSTKYGDEVGLNEYEKFTVKVLNTPVSDFEKFERGQKVELDLTDAIAKVWGDYRNNLSLTVKGIKAVK